MVENAREQMNESIQEIKVAKEEIQEIEAVKKETKDIKLEALNELKGIFSEALGGLSFQIGICLVIVYHILYISYKAFLQSRIYTTIEDDCYCNERDKVVYRTITFTLMGVWVLFLPTYAFYAIINHFTCSEWVCCKDVNDSYEDDRQKIKELFEKYNSQIEQRKEYFLNELRDMITTYYLDHVHYNNKRLKLEIAEANRATDLRQENEVDEPNEDEADAISNALINWKKWCSCTKNCSFMLLKFFLISIRFGFRLAIIPLLQLHWLDNYAWNCIFNNLLRSYCSTITNEYLIGLDHLLVVYAMYFFILIAVLFSIIIEWFPRGLPKFVLKFEGNFNSLTLNVADRKRKKGNRKK